MTTRSNFVTEKVIAGKEIPRFYVTRLFVYFYSGGLGSRLGPLGTSATHWPIVPAPGDCEDGEFGGMNSRGNRSTRRNPEPTPLCPPQIPLDQTRDWTRAAVVGSQRLTASAMARPCSPTYMSSPPSGKLLKKISTWTTVTPRTTLRSILGRQAVRRMDLGEVRSTARLGAGDVLLQQSCSNVLLWTYTCMYKYSKIFFKIEPYGAQIYSVPYRWRIDALLGKDLETMR
jgi:hypothetical protein